MHLDSHEREERRRLEALVGGPIRDAQDGRQRLAGLIDAHHGAMLEGDVNATMALRAKARAVRKLVAETLGAAADLSLTAVAKAPVNHEPKWGQGGAWMIEVAQIRATITTEGLFGLSASACFWIGFEALAVDFDAPFISETGYRWFDGLDDAPAPGVTPSRFVRETVERHVGDRMGGQLVAIDKPARRASADRTVSVPRTRIEWTGLAGWTQEVLALARSQRASSVFYGRSIRLHRSLGAEDIRNCRDVEVLDLADRLIEGMAGARLLHGPERSFTRDEIGALRVEIHNQRQRIVSGALDRPPRQKGPRLDPSLIPDEKLDALIQRHRDMAVVEALRAERERRIANRSVA